MMSVVVRRQWRLDTSWTMERVREKAVMTEIQARVLNIHARVVDRGCERSVMKLLGSSILYELLLLWILVGEQKSGSLR